MAKGGKHHNPPVDPPDLNSPPERIPSAEPPSMALANAPRQPKARKAVAFEVPAKITWVQNLTPNYLHIGDLAEHGLSLTPFEVVNLESRVSRDVLEKSVKLRANAAAGKLLVLAGPSDAWSADEAMEFYRQLEKKGESFVQKYKDVEAKEAAENEPDED